ncbi:polysaccharide export protein [Corallococcus sp. H22C18031201]|uniref:polysaccharide biosynthesis/export family protein n=1 Tax=Citreicoccus inhibens TaxID=2849499 RepID=UPI000E73E4A2|nr:polysaccharide biosynthesis/export family protein [Citreicoccus inhibens]MBU8899556.1 polysaccharide export protein [Citreicoccus inhibens]RJS18118.1 polysaccharide export protein [Corallococcus sp. H22C18031201]
MRTLRSLLALAVLGTTSACHTAARPPAPPTPPPSEATHTAEAGGTLGPGDVVEVRVFQEPDHSGTWRVSPEGTIDYPLCNKVPLEGRTSSGAADALQECLSHYLRHPQVSVLIREYNSRKVFVFGEVQKPGTFPVDGRMSIIQAITLAGGFTKMAAKNNTQVTRVVDGQERKIRVPVEDIGAGREKNFLLQPDDIVMVPESFF